MLAARIDGLQKIINFTKATEHGIGRATRWNSACPIHGGDKFSMGIYTHSDTEFLVKCDKNCDHHLWLDKLIDKNMELKAVTSNGIQCLKLTIKEKQSRDDFFLSAPGLVGDITRELNSYCKQPFPSFCFAVACTVVSALKGSYIRTDYSQVASNLYFMCFAPTGTGKDDPRAMMISALARGGKALFLTQKFRSAQGFLLDLNKGEGIQTVLHDEANHFFKMMRSSSDNYIASIKPLLLELFSSWKNPLFSPGTVINTLGKLRSIPYPSVSYCGFGVPEGAVDTFQKEDFEQGFLSRFIIFHDERPPLELTDLTPSAPESFEFEQNASWQKLLTDSEAAFEKRQFISGTAIKMDFTLVPYEPDAKKAYQAYSRAVKRRREAAIKASEPDIYSRAVEIVARLALTLSDDKSIKLATIEYSIEVVENYLAWVRKLVYDYSRTDFAQKADKILEFMRKKSNPINTRDLQAGIWGIGKSYEIDEILEHLEQQSKIVQVLTPGHLSNRRAKSSYTLK